MTTRKRTRMRIRAVPTAALLAMLATGLLAGCGSGDDGSQVASVSDGKSAGSDAPDKDEVAQAQEFVDCMRANGIEMEDPDPKTGKLNLQEVAGAGADRKALSDGLDACRDKAPQALQDRADEADDPEALQAFTDCMRDNGVEMEDPGPEGIDPESLPTEDADYQTALDTCREDLVDASGGDR